jgi:putative transposase
MSRSGLYYEPVIDPYDATLMHLIDELPFCGSRKIAETLQRMGHAVGRKRVQRLTRTMGIEAIYPKPDLSKPHPEHSVYRYLLRNAVIEGPDAVWAADITYIRLLKGFTYLVAIMDWYSRYVILSGGRLLHQRPSEGTDVRETGDLQHRPGISVYEQPLHQTAHR